MNIYTITDGNLKVTALAPSQVDALELNDVKSAFFSTVLPLSVSKVSPSTFLPLNVSTGNPDAFEIEHTAEAWLTLLGKTPKLLKIERVK